MIKKESFYPLKKKKNFRTYIELAYTNKKKSEKPHNWSPFVNKTSFSLEKKVEKQLKAEMEKNLIIEEENTRFLQAEHRVFLYIFSKNSKHFKKSSNFFWIPKN